MHGYMKMYQSDIKFKFPSFYNIVLVFIQVNCLFLSYYYYKTYQ